MWDRAVSVASLVLSFPLTGEHSFFFIPCSSRYNFIVLKIAGFNFKFPYEIIKANKSGSLIKVVFDILHTCFKVARLDFLGLIPSKFEH